MKKMFIHAGTHKTGTTAIQLAMHSAREHLQEHGIYWPEINQKFNHHNFIRYIHTESEQPHLSGPC